MSSRSPLLLSLPALAVTEVTDVTEVKAVTEVTEVTQETGISLASVGQWKTKKHSSSCTCPNTVCALEEKGCSCISAKTHPIRYPLCCSLR